MPIRIVIPQNVPGFLRIRQEIVTFVMKKRMAYADCLLETMQYQISWHYSVAPTVIKKVI